MARPASTLLARSRSLSSYQLLPLLVILVMVAYANLLPHFQVVAAAGADSSGYQNEARLISHRTLHVAQPAVAGIPAGQLAENAFVPLGFRPVAAGQMVPTYPIGLPALIAVTPALSGWENAAGPVIWVHTLGALVLMYVIARQQGVTRRGSFVAVLVLAASPLFLLSSEQALSDVPALTWCAAAATFAWSAQGRARWGAAAGFAFAAAVAIRPTNALLLLPIAVALGTHLRRWTAFALGALPGALALGAVQHELYGSAFSTGYGNIGPLLRWGYVLPTLGEYAWALPMLLTPLALLGLGLPWVARQSGRSAAFLLTWAAVFLVFYAFYFCTHEQWWYLRFILPAVPPLIVAALMVLEALARRLRRPLGLTGALVAGLGALAWGGGWDGYLHVLTIPQYDRTYAAAIRWMHRHVPANAVVAAMQASGALYWDGAYPLLRYDQYAVDRLPPATLAGVAGHLAAQGRPLLALLAPFEVRPALEQFMPGHWSLVGVVGDWTIWQLEDLTPTPVRERNPRVFARLDSPAGEVEALVGDSWYGIEPSVGHVRDWSRGDSTLELLAQPKADRSLWLRCWLDSAAAVDVRITQEGKLLWSGTVQHASPPLALPIELRAGRATVRFSTAAAGVPEPAADGNRLLKFAVVDPRLEVQ